MRPSRFLFGLLAVSAGLTVANLYYAQPLLAAIAASFHAPEAAAGRLVTLAQLGYGIGMLALVPLGDRVERRALIVTMTFVVALALVLVALAPTLGWLSVASFLLGAATIVPQLIVPFAAGIARKEERGQALGIVMAGLLVGILGSRTVSGLVGAWVGWRPLYAGAAVLMVLLALLLRVLLPAQPPERVVPARELFASLGHLARTEPVLRRHALLGGLTFAAFSAFWTTLVFALAAPPFGYGSGVAGLFGLIGIVGALAAPLVGRFADRHDPAIVNRAALLTVLASFAIFALFRHSLVGLAGGVVLLDVGVQSNHVSNQTRIFGRYPELRNRVNTVYMVTYFAGGAFGSWLGTVGWSVGGWLGVCAAGALLTILALVVFATVAPNVRDARPQLEPSRPRA